jgi:hypothetical protein
MSNISADELLGEVIDVKFEAHYELRKIRLTYSSGKVIIIVADSFRPDQFSTEPKLRVVRLIRKIINNG